jgi:hypothetical protein
MGDWRETSKGQLMVDPSEILTAAKKVVLSADAKVVEMAAKWAVY